MARLTRNVLPTRRANETWDFTFNGIRYTVGVGYYENGDVGEIFTDVPGKSGTLSEVTARDLAVALSIAIQYGAPIEVLRNAMTRLADGGPAGPGGAIMDNL